MPELLERDSSSAGNALPRLAAAEVKELVAGWRKNLAVLKIRGDATDERFRTAVTGELAVEVPTLPCTLSDNQAVRMLWVGPDDWFIIAAERSADRLSASLRAALADQHFAVTDVSSGYTVLHLSGIPARDVLSQGCPLDLHPRVFGTGACAGSHFFKASIVLWQTDDTPTYELLVRRSFMGYVWLMLESTTRETGLLEKHFS